MTRVTRLQDRRNAKKFSGMEDYLSDFVKTVANGDTRHRLRIVCSARDRNILPLRAGVLHSLSQEAYYQKKYEGVVGSVPCVVFQDMSTQLIIIFRG